MTRRKVLPAMLLTVLAATMMLFAGCKSTEKGTSTWTTNGGDPSFQKQKEVSADKLMQFGVYPQTKAESAVQSAIKSKVVMDEVTGLWNEYEDDTMFARYDLQTGYFVYAAKADGVRQPEQYFMECNGNLYLVEPLQWIVLETIGSDSIIISNKIIDSGRPYSDLYGECTWADSSLRSWINGTDAYDINAGTAYREQRNFINRAFTEAEIAAIKSTSLTTQDNETYHTSGGSQTSDKIYFLSAAEFEKYFKTEGSELNATAYATGFAQARGASVGKEQEATWWLRNPGMKTYMCGVDRAGTVAEGGYAVNDTNIGIRPVLRVPTSMLEKVPAPSTATPAK